MLARLSFLILPGRGTSQYVSLEVTRKAWQISGLASRPALTGGMSYALYRECAGRIAAEKGEKA
jgi:hypothetical protein